MVVMATLLIFSSIASNVQAANTDLTVRIALPVEPELLDPANDTVLSSQSVMSNIFDALVDYDGRGGFTPALAE